MSKIVQYETRACPVCGQTSFAIVAEDALERWLTGTLAQVAFPEMTADEREVMISGTHPECWRKLWSDDETVGRRFE